MGTVRTLCPAEGEALSAAGRRKPGFSQAVAGAGLVLASLLLALGTVALAAVPRRATPPAKVPAWQSEVFPDEVNATLSDDSRETRLTLFCRTSSKRVGYKLSTTPYDVRFDSDPVQRFTDVAQNVPALIAALMTHRRMLIRAQVGYMQQVGEVTFTLAGAEAALKPLVTACDLPAPTSAPGPAATGTRPPAAKSPERQRIVEGWSVVEGTSSFDDKPIVLVSGGGVPRHALHVRCREGKIEVFVDTPCYDNSLLGPPATVKAEFDDGSSTTHRTGCSTDRDARFLLDAPLFLKEAMRNQGVKLTYPGIAKEESLDLVLKGLAAAAAPLLAACPAAE